MVKMILLRPYFSMALKQTFDFIMIRPCLLFYAVREKMAMTLRFSDIPGFTGVKIKNLNKTFCLDKDWVN